MRDYGKVYATFWSSSTTSSLTGDGKLLALYLMTCSHSTIAGVFRLPDGYVSEDLGWTPERVREGFLELLSKGFANRCETTKWAWVVKHLEWNKPENPNQRKSAAKVALSIPDECAWKLDFMRVCGPSLDLEAPKKGNGSATVPKPLLNQKQKQKQEQKKQPPQPPDDSGGAFDRFWSAWPPSTRKAAKPQCRAKWESKGCDAIAERVMASLEAHKASSQWTKDKGAFIPAPLVWLNQERWEAATEAQQHDDAGKWDDSRSSIERAGEGAGLGRWDQEAFEHGRGETFAAYTARVRRAIEQPEEVPA